MDDERHGEQAEAERQSDARQQEAVDRYQRAQTSGSVEGERAALHALDVQILQNRLDRLERRVTSLEDEVTALRSGRQEKAL